MTNLSPCLKHNPSLPALYFFYQKLVVLSNSSTDINIAFDVGKVSNIIGLTSVTRLGDFRKVLVASFLLKVAEFYGDFLGYFEKI